MKTKKRTKASRMHGRRMGTHGWGARKKHKKTGHRGGKGMSGSGKRADHKKTLINKLYGHGYFGKQGITSKGTKKDKGNRINLQLIEKNLQIYGKKVGDKFEINLKSYKILGTGEVKNKLIIKAKEASKSAIDKVKRAGGEIILPIKKEMVALKEKQKIESSPNVVASLKEKAEQKSSPNTVASLKEKAEQKSSPNTVASLKETKNKGKK